MIAFPISKFKKKQKKHGFALVASMILMMLLAIIAVGLMVLASTQNRIAMQNMFVAAARQQALVGLDVAIGQLQLEMGPDQRVSANSGILNQNENGEAANLLGVWNSWDGPIYGSSLSGKGNKISDTYDKGRSKMFRRWLISSKNPQNTTQLSDYAQLSSRAPGERICLVGEGTLGSEGRPQDYIYADLITMPQEKNLQAQFAWWVGGENQKAKLNIKAPEETDDMVELIRRTWDTPAALFKGSEELDFLPDEIETPDKILTLGSLPLVTDESRGAGTPYFFDATTYSYSLATNVRTGGLKQDLSLLLNKEKLEGTDFARRSKQDAPLVEQGGDVPQASVSELPIGSWQNLHAYHNTWPDGSGTDNAFSARMSGSISKPYTRMSGSGYKNGKYENNANNVKEGSYDTKTLLDEGSASSGYARVPVLLSFMKSFFMVSEPVSSGEGEPRYTFSLGYTPIVLWWNPYNVPMHITGEKLWIHTIPYKTMWLQTFTKHSDGKPARWTNYCMMQPGVPDLNNQGGAVAYNTEQSFGLDYGQFFIKDKGAGKQDIVFEPGEILIFTPSAATALEDQKRQSGNPFINEYNPKMTSGYRAYLYSNHTEQAIKADDKPLYIRLGTDEANVPVSSAGVMGRDFSGAREAITYRNGFGGISGGDISNDTVGKDLNSAHRFSIAWYDATMLKSGTEIMDRTEWQVDGSQNDNDLPFYVAAVGITPKSANNTLRTRFATGDYRTKSWQHSPSFFAGSRLIKPDETMRTYHPYQVVNVELGGGLSASPIESVGKNGFYGMTTEGEQVSFISAQELPVHPPLSLAGYSGMALKPGWYDVPNSSRHIDNEDGSVLVPQQYQAGVPGVGIGNSFADPTLPADAVYVTQDLKYPVTDSMETSQFNDFYDHGLLINDALWDRFFTSSITDMPTRKGKQEAQEVLENFLDGTEPLPVSRYKKVHTPYNNASIVKRLMQEDGWKYVAQYIMIDGGFNINSTSIPAWEATLKGLAKRKLVAYVGGRLTEVEEGKDSQEVVFSRFMLSTTDQSTDSLGGYSMMQGSTQLRNSGLAAAWGEVRKLDADGIKHLAEEMVKIVRKRGPFLNMSDFINRRLDSGDEESSLTGALQAAIDETDINVDFKEIMANTPSEGNLYKFSKAAEGSIHTAAPGYLIQSDVLMSLGNILTVRDDTFLVRSYGCIKRGDTILAQAWCEAVVQRTLDYVDPSNKASDSQYKPDGTQGEKLSNVNLLMGRKMKIVSFRWLDHWDI